MSDRTSPDAIAKSDLEHRLPLEDASDRRPQKASKKVLDWFDLFHPWDFITAKATEGKPDWTSITGYPLSRETLYKRWQNPNEIIGVRFSTNKTSNGGLTWYLMIDIDIGSQYHPYNDIQQFFAVLAALRSLGLNQFIRVRSSPSEGLHLYFPLPKPLSCYKLALAVQNCLIQAGFVVKPGQLELFPNVRSSNRMLYAAHRLMLQIGSYVLDERFQPVHNSLERLIDEWCDKAAQQDFELLEEIVAVAHSFTYSGSGDGTEWKFRLESVIERGWTDHGQTNGLVRDYCTYAIVFLGLKGYEAEHLVSREIVRLPGYEQYCQHKHEIERRVRDWVKCNEKNNKYFPYGSRAKKPKEPKAPSNGERSQDALQRIKGAIAAMIARDGALPKTVKARQELICKEAGCSATTLRKHLDLWHPQHMKADTAVDTTSVSVSVELEILSISQESEQPVSISECVTLDAESVSGDSVSNGSSQAVSETNEKSMGYTPSLLSVSSSSPSIREERTQQRLIGEKAVEHQLEIKPYSIVQRRSDKAWFRVHRINRDGTCWAKWMNQPVPLVAVILRLSDLELVDTQQAI